MSLKNLMNATANAQSEQLQKSLQRQRDWNEQQRQRERISHENELAAMNEMHERDRHSQNEMNSQIRHRQNMELQIAELNIFKKLENKVEDISSNFEKITRDFEEFKRKSKREKIWNWVKYSVTTMIALGGVVIAIVSCIKS